MDGWTLLPNTEENKAKLVVVIEGPNNVRVLKGSVAKAFQWLFRQYERRVERIIPEWCWGYNYRKIADSDKWSEHAYALAVDLNAPDNPMGNGTTPTSMTRSQIEQCHEIERESHGVFRWGGDFSRNDPMHWEINASPEKVAAFVEEIEDMDNPWGYDIDPSAKTYSAGGALWTILGRTNTLNSMPESLAKLTAKLNEMVADSNTDFDALAASLTLINAKLDFVISKLPEENPQVS